jgi:multidrug resistance efflux pump
MLRLRTHTRAAPLKTPAHIHPVRWGKRIYFVLLLALAAGVADYAVGDAVFLRADGLVVSDRQVVASPYAGRVAAVRVREGERVTADQTLVEIESPDMLRDIAEVAGQGAERAARETQLRMRAAMLAALLPLAERGAQESTEVVRRLDPVPDRGTAAVSRTEPPSGAGFETAARLAGLRGEAAVLNRELPMLDASRTRAEEALTQLESFYAGGRVRAMHDGIVGAPVPAPGGVVRFGDALTVIRTGEPYVIAWLPDITLFEVAEGDRVALTAGRVRAEGTVETLLPAADTWPSELQAAVGPRDRGRPVRIRLPEGHPFAVSQKVRVRGCLFGWC